MKIRNLPYNKLNFKEKIVALAFFKECREDKGQTVRNDPKEQQIDTFWERHRTVDTVNGTFEGWVDFQDVENITSAEIIDTLDENEVEQLYFLVTNEINMKEYLKEYYKGGEVDVLSDLGDK